MGPLEALVTDDEWSDTPNTITNAFISNDQSNMQPSQEIHFNELFFNSHYSVIARERPHTFTFPITLMDLTKICNQRSVIKVIIIYFIYSRHLKKKESLKHILLDCIKKMQHFSNIV